MYCEKNGISESYRVIGENFESDKIAENTRDNKFRSPKWHVVKVCYSIFLLIFEIASVIMNYV